MARTKQQELDRLLIAFAEIPWQRKAKDHQLLSFVLPGYQAGLIKKLGSGWMVSDEGVERLFNLVAKDLYKQLFRDLVVKDKAFHLQSQARS